MPDTVPSGLTGAHTSGLTDAVTGADAFRIGRARPHAVGMATPIATTDPTVPDQLIGGPGPAPLELNVNGSVHRLSVEPRVTLADALREIGRASCRERVFRVV